MLQARRQGQDRLCLPGMAPYTCCDVVVLSLLPLQRVDVSFQRLYRPLAFGRLWGCALEELDFRRGRHISWPLLQLQTSAPFHVVLVL